MNYRRVKVPRDDLLQLRFSTPAEFHHHLQRLHEMWTTTTMPYHVHLYALIRHKTGVRHVTNIFARGDHE